MGRPSLKTPELIEAICARLETGEPLTRICAADEMPIPRTVRLWQETDEEVNAAIARARSICFDAIADHALTIIDDVAEDPASRRVRLDGRLKLLAKWDPKRYGETVDHKHSGSIAFNATKADESVL